MRLPVLVVHYFEHKGTAGELSVADFIGMHYFTDTIDSDYARDQQLPFKGSDCINVAVPLALLPSGFSKNLTVPFFHVMTALEYEESQPTSDFQFSIWQPPKA
jgi:hypothetical protein